MDPATLESIIRATLQSRFVTDRIEFLWHAGEPLTAGLAFYENAVNLVRRWNDRGIEVMYSVQTNGTLVDGEWCRFFSANHFSVGLSLDGPEFLHDKQRVNWAGLGSHRSAMRGLNLLKEHGIVPGAICVLARSSLRHPDQIFNFFLESGVRQIAFNLEEVENCNKQSSFSTCDESLRIQIVEECREFWSRFYDLWRPHARRIRVREFDAIFNVITELLKNKAYCRKPLETVGLGIVTICKNGDIIPFCPEFAGAKSVHFGDFVVGNSLNDGSFDQVVHNPMFQKIQTEVEHGVRECANSCDYFPLCGGAFVSNKYFENGSLRSTETTTCRLHRQTLASVLLDKLTADPGGKQSSGSSCAPQ